MQAKKREEESIFQNYSTLLLDDGQSKREESKVWTNIIRSVEQC